jgi:hypothetical protein
MKVNMVYDTVEKTLTVDFDGAKVEDVTNVEFYGIWSHDNNEYSGKYSMCISSAKKNEDGTAEMYRVCVSENGDIVEAEERKEEKSKDALIKEVAKILGSE